MWAETDRSGQAYGQGCKGCHDVRVEAFKHLEWAQLVTKLQSKDRSEETKAFQRMFEEARDAKEQMGISEDTPILPASDCMVVTSCGYQLFQDVGLAREEDIKRWTNKSSKALGIKADRFTTLDFQGERFEALPVSLAGLPPDELAAIPKCRIYQIQAAQHDEMHLDHTKQLIQPQGNTVFNFLAQKHQDSRPSAFSLDKKATHFTRDDLILKAQDLERPGSPEEKEEDGSDSEGFQKKPRRAAPKVALGSLQAVDPVKAEKMAKAAKQSARKRRAARKEEEEDGEPCQSDGDADNFSDTTNVSKKIAETLESLKLDEEMQAVAQAHISHKKSGGVNCLLKLNVKTFLEEPKLGVCLHGAGVYQMQWIVRQFQKSNPISNNVSFRSTCYSLPPSY